MQRCLHCLWWWPQYGDNLRPWQSRQDKSAIPRLMVFKAVLVREAHPLTRPSKTEMPRLIIAWSTFRFRTSTGRSPVIGPGEGGSHAGVALHHLWRGAWVSITIQTPETPTDIIRIKECSSLKSYPFQLLLPFSKLSQDRSDLEMKIMYSF